MSAIRIGISGWRYVPWRKRFYPADLPQKRELEYASRRFATIELNGSFYSLQRPESWERWRDATPEGFVFAVKGSRYITHLLRLRNVRVPLANFLASGVLLLREKLGPFLWQLPPQMKFEPAVLEEFLDLLPRDTAEALALARSRDARTKGRAKLPRVEHAALRHALEVRHPSFRDERLVELLRRRKVALVVADTARRFPLFEDVTAEFVYVRLHGDEELYASGYGDAALDDWARRMRAWSAGSQVPDARTLSPRKPPRGRKDVYAYFDNDIKVKAPFDAMRLADRLGAGVHSKGELAAGMKRAYGALKSTAWIRARERRRSPWRMR